MFVAHTNQTETKTEMPRTGWKATTRHELCPLADLIASKFQRIVVPMLRRVVGNVHEFHTLSDLHDTPSTRAHF